MIDLFEFAALLGDEASDLSEDEVERIRDLEYHIADALFENWLRQRTLTPNSELEETITNVYND